MTYRFVCTNCGKKFELEIPEAKECPFCYWSSSVKREDLLVAEKGDSSLIGKGKSQGLGDGFFARGLKYFFRSLLFIAILAGVGILGYKAYQIIVSSFQKDTQPLSIKIPSKGKNAEKVSARKEAATLSTEEKTILSRKITIMLDRAPDQGEREILSRTVPFQTGWAENLPSVAWTLVQYQTMLQDQERIYKMPFSRSYKKKLEDLFTAKYLGGAEAFANGDILAARDLWMESLSFPAYSTDLRKHRAVALTMLRPFINDTLAKIRALNQSLTDKDQRAEEQTLTGRCQDLANLIAQKKWEEAIAAIDQLTPLVADLQKKAKLSHAPPPYPASFGMIDQDIQRPLMDLMTTNPSSLADLQPLQQDLVEKREVLETFSEAYVKDVNEKYQTALELIRQQKWQEAIQSLETIQGPRELQEDAAQKVAILKKLASY